MISLLIPVVASLSADGLPFFTAQAVVIKRSADSSEADTILVNIFFIHISTKYNFYIV
jgi:hypothetical protein